MADSKLSSLPTLVNPASEDLLYVVDNPNGTPVSKQITLGSLLNSLPSNTAINANLTVAGNTSVTNVTATSLTVSGDKIVIQTKYTPPSSNTSAVPVNAIWFDANYIYVKVDANTIKRSALTNF